MITTIECEAADETMPITALCVAMGASRATVYRHREGSATMSPSTSLRRVGSAYVLDHPRGLRLAGET